MKILKKLFPFFLIVILSYFSYKPFLETGFFPIHDDTQVARVFEMTKSLKSGMFPVRWVEDLGYGLGYPIFNYYNPLPYYIGGFLGLLGINALLSTKAIFVLAIILSGISMFLLARQFWGGLGGILSALFYTYAPYHAVDIYVRGDLAETFAYALIPLVFYGLWKVFKEKKYVFVILASISYVLLITSHNLTAMMVSPFLLAFSIYLVLKERKEQIKNALNLFGALFLGIAISSFYTIPALLEINFSNVFSQIGGGADFRDHFVCSLQLWTSTWGFGGSVKGCVDGVSFMIGKYHIVLAVFIFAAAVVSFFWKKRFDALQIKGEKFNIVLLAFLGFLISVFFMLSVSRFFWEILKPMEFIQYPWRFLILASFFSSFVSGGVLWGLLKFTKNIKLKYLWSFLLYLFIVFVSIKFFIPQSVITKNVTDYTNPYSLKWTTSRISDEYLPKDFIRPKNYNEIKSFDFLQNDNLIIKNIDRKTQQINLDTDVLKQGSIILPLAYFPSWKAYVDEKATEISNQNGLSSIILDKGKHKISFKFESTPIQMTSNLVSLAGIISLIAGIIYTTRKKYE